MIGTMMIGDTQMDYKVGVDINQWASLLASIKSLANTISNRLISKGEDRTSAPKS